MENYDLIIIGGSAAATSAGIYAARRGLNFKIITKEFGGEVATSGEIGNWPGIPQTDGLTLADAFLGHLKSLNVEPELDVVVESVKRQDDGTFCITALRGGAPAMAAEKLPDGENDASQKCDYLAKAVILTTGVHPRELGIPGEKEFRNKGVSYCSTCDMPLFADKTVVTVGGGNSALESALMGADIAQKTYVLNKNPQFKGDQVLIDNLKSKKNVEILYGAMASEIYGKDFVEGIKYKEQTGNIQDIKTDGIFVHIGMVPNSGIIPPEVERSKFSEIKVNSACETNVPGLFAAGDVTDVPFKQIIIAAGQGTIAALSAVSYLNRLNK